MVGFEQVNAGWVRSVVQNILRTYLMNDPQGKHWGLLLAEMQVSIAAVLFDFLKMDSTSDDFFIMFKGQIILQLHD